MEEFIRIREEIDAIIDESRLAIQHKTVTNSMIGIENAYQLLLKLEKQAEGVAQDQIVAKRSATLRTLTESIQTLLSRKSVKKAKVA